MTTPTQVLAPRRCVGAREFRIHVRYDGRNIRKLVVLAGGKEQKVLVVRPRPVVLIDLKGKGKEQVAVRIRITTRSGRRIEGRRVYRTCTPKRPGGGLPKL